MSHHAVDLLRKYSQIINEAQQSEQLNEGITDMLQPLVQKLANAIMSKIDPATAQQLKQAYDQAGGDKDKFMSAIGITKDDVAKIAPEPPKGSQSAPAQPAPAQTAPAQTAPAQPAPAPQMNEWLSAYEKPNAPLKVKILNLLANGIPLAGFLTALAGVVGAAVPTSWPFIIWYFLSAALVWGAGHYEFSDAFKDESKGKAAYDADVAMLQKQIDQLQKLMKSGGLSAYQEGSAKIAEIKQQYLKLKAKYNKDPDGYTSSVTDPNAPTPASKINPVNRNPV
jgi:hypothetical protein